MIVALLLCSFLLAGTCAPEGVHSPHRQHSSNHFDFEEPARVEDGFFRSHLFTA